MNSIIQTPSENNQIMQQNEPTAVVVGRWQIYHKGHQSLIQRALGIAKNVVVVIGSAYGSRSTPNPFNWKEREEMIRSTLTDDEKLRIQFLPIRDYYDNDKWNLAVTDGLHNLVGNRSRITLVGFDKDDTSYYLYAFPQWERDLIEKQEVEIDATTLRHMFFMADHLPSAMSIMKNYVDKSVLDYMQAWSYLPAYQHLKKEYMAIDAYKKKWTADVYLTSDALVTWNRFVLLIQRGGDIGHGQWALPGGFVNKNERFFEASLRELGEETSYHPYAPSMQRFCKSKEIFDHPKRSARGRIITVVYHFNLANDTCPEVKAADDAIAVQWFDKDELHTIEHLAFEDHRTIWGDFLGV